MPVLKRPPISAKSLRIPERAGGSASEFGSGSGKDGREAAAAVGEGGGARKEATPQNWRLRVLVSSERSSLTPLLGFSSSPPRPPPLLSLSSCCFFGVFRVLMMVSSSSSLLVVSDFREFAIDLVNHDISTQKQRERERERESFLMFC